MSGLYHGNRFVRWLIATIVCLSLLVGIRAQKTVFPGELSAVKSPDGRYTIRNTDDETQTPAHILALVDNANGKKIKTYSYGRHVDVLWAPMSNAFVVNDYEGSDSSRPILFAAPWTGNPIDLRQKLTEFLKTHRGARSILNNHHVYVSAQNWLSENEIVCELTAYGDADPKGIKKQYIYTLNKGFRPQSVK